MYPNPIFIIGKYPVHLYGVFIAIGLIACFIVFYVYTKKKGMPTEIQDFSFVVIFIAVVLGFLSAYLFQAVYNLIENGVLKFGGITAMGGFIGGAIAFIAAYFVGGKIYFKGRRAKFDYKGQFNTIVLVAPICISIAHAFGRLGCLTAGCCHGTYLGSKPVAGGLHMYGGSVAFGDGYYIPVQLYEAIFLFALFAVLSVLYFKRSNIIMQVYLIAYAVWRFIIEFFRGDAVRGQFLGIYFSQWQSIVFVLIAVVMFIVYRKKNIPFRLPKTQDVTQKENVLIANESESKDE